ncbi:hypothetical protein V500_00519 [Pseudogymnoascus sp. VKM F-4518 (FW-2643)]|nr:hypothetical protein V500_00519 [Pseudogymnoascus sp. VKM F-4518 (FW-2643)]
MVAAQGNRRGPAKGYTEALEARLLETENILLGCLSTISNDNLHAVLSQSFQLALERQTSLSMGLPKSSTVQRKAVIDYWGRFPLTSPAGVSHWYHDRAESGDAIRASSQMWPEDVSQSTETAARINVREEPTSRNGEPFDMNVDELEPLQNYHTAGKIRNDPHDNEVYKEQFDQYKGTQTTANQPSWPDDPLLGPVADKPHSRSSTINNTVDCGLGLPAEFQEAFLW